MKTKQVKPVGVAISRRHILKSTKEYLDAIEQWVEIHHYANAAKYASRAECLIELLEIDDCGSVGGFDTVRNQSRPRTLMSRYEWLRDLPISKK